MKKSYFSKLLASLLLATGVGSSSSFGQTSIEKIFQSGTKDAENYLNEYMKSTLLAFGQTQNTGWYHTAKTHKLLGFDLTVAFNGAFMSESDKTFVFNNNNFNTFKHGTVQSIASSMPAIKEFIPSANTVTLPTFIGESDESKISELHFTQDLTYNDGTQNRTTKVSAGKLKIPGTGYGDIPGITGVGLPTLTLTLGLVKDTDLSIRYFPSVSVDGYSTGVFGMGVKHNIKQWIPVIKHIPLDLSGFFAFSNLNLGTKVNNYDVDFGINSWTLQVIASKKLLFLTPYIALGYSQSSYSLSTSSDFEVQAPIVKNDGTIMTEPKLINSKISDSAGSVRATLGLSVKLLWVLNLNAEYTLANYNTASVGLGITIR